MLQRQNTASGSHLDLGRAPYVLYGVKYIDLVSLSRIRHVAKTEHWPRVAKTEHGACDRCTRGQSITHDIVARLSGFAVERFSGLTV